MSYQHGFERGGSSELSQRPGIRGFQSPGLQRGKWRQVFEAWTPAELGVESGVDQTKAAQPAPSPLSAVEVCDAVEAVLHPPQGVDRPNQAA